MKSDYQAQAEQFCKKHGVKISVKEATDKMPLWAKDGDNYGIHYRVKIERNGKKWNFSYWGSIHDQENGGKTPTSYDILACITKNDPEDFGSFISEFGYTTDSRASYKNTERIYKAVVKEWENANRIFGDVLDELQEIA